MALSVILVVHIQYNFCAAKGHFPQCLNAHTVVIGYHMRFTYIS